MKRVFLKNNQMTYLVENHYLIENSWYNWKIIIIILDKLLLADAYLTEK